MRIVIICEGETESALVPGLREFLDRKGIMPRIGITPLAMKGRVTGRSAKPAVERFLKDADVVGVIVLSDVYPDQCHAAEIRRRIAQEIGTLSKPQSVRFHAAQYELEAWIIPFWEEICTSLRKTLKSPPKRPGAKPEEINGQNPPSKRLYELYRKAGTDYQKAKHGPRWLTASNLEKSASVCPELKSFLNSLLEFAGGKPLP